MTPLQEESVRRGELVEGILQAVVDGPEETWSESHRKHLRHQIHTVADSDALRLLEDLKIRSRAEDS